MVAHLDREKGHAETVLAWREWLLDNHQTADGIWLLEQQGRPLPAGRRMVETEAVDKAARGERANQWQPRHRR